MTTDPTAPPLARLVGTWATEATHPAMPGVVVHGTAVVERMEGGHFLVLRARTDHPDFPDSLAVVGDMTRDRVDGAAQQGSAAADAPLRMHYFDVRGVFRDYATRMDDAAWHIWRDAAGFAQRFTGTFADDGDTIDGRWQLCRDGVHWADDLRITYRQRRA